MTARSQVHSDFLPWLMVSLVGTILVPAIGAGLLRLAFLLSWSGALPLVTVATVISLLFFVGTAMDQITIHLWTRRKGLPLHRSSWFSTGSVGIVAAICTFGSWTLCTHLLPSWTIIDWSYDLWVIIAVGILYKSNL